MDGTPAASGDTYEAAVGVVRVANGRGIPPTTADSLIWTEKRCDSSQTPADERIAMFSRDSAADGLMLRAIVHAAVLTLAAAGLIACGEVPARTTTPDTGTPCAGTQVPLADARASAIYDLVEPQAPLSNSNNLGSVYQCSTVAGGFLLMYDSGVGVLESLNTLKDPATEWQGLADSYKEFSVGEINGSPASLADPAVDDAIGGVDFVVGDVRYTVSGDGTIPLEDLVGVAKSLPVETAI